MKTSTEIASASKIVGEEKAIELIAKAGFDHWDFSMFANMCKFDWGTGKLSPNDHPLAGENYASYAKKLKSIGLDNGISCNQSHAPFPICSKEVRDFMKRAIECSAIAGAKVCIIHPDNFKSAKENAEIYYELLPFAKQYGVKIATENMWNWERDAESSSPAACSTSESIVAHIDEVNDDDFVACLDIGHAEMRGSGSGAVNMIKALGKKRLAALHIHDNDRLHDSHMIPFSMNIDFDSVVGALYEIGYCGDFTLECDNHLPKFDAENIFVGIKQLADTARRLADMFEKLEGVK